MLFLECPPKNKSGHSVAKARPASRPHAHVAPESPGGDGRRPWLAYSRAYSRGGERKRGARGSRPQPGPRGLPPPRVPVGVSAGARGITPLAAARRVPGRSPDAHWPGRRSQAVSPCGVSARGRPRLNRVCAGLEGARETAAAPTPPPRSILASPPSPPPARPPQVRAPARGRSRPPAAVPGLGAEGGAGNSHFGRGRGYRRPGRRDPAPRPCSPLGSSCSPAAAPRWGAALESSRGDPPASRGRHPAQWSATSAGAAEALYPGLGEGPRSALAAPGAAPRGPEGGGEQPPTRPGRTAPGRPWLPLGALWSREGARQGGEQLSVLRPHLHRCVGGRAAGGQAWLRCPRFPIQRGPSSAALSTPSLLAFSLPEPISKASWPWLFLSWEGLGLSLE